MAKKKGFTVTIKNHATGKVEKMNLDIVNVALTTLWETVRKPGSFQEDRVASQVVVEIRGVRHNPNYSKEYEKAYKGLR
jgi:hypothetical protein